MSAKWKRPHTVWSHLSDVFKWACGQGRRRGNRFRGGTDVLNARVVMVSQLSKYNKRHWVAYFRRVKFMVCQLYCNLKVHGEGWVVGRSIQRPAMKEGSP